MTAVVSDTVLASQWEKERRIRKEGSERKRERKGQRETKEKGVVTH